MNKLFQSFHACVILRKVGEVNIFKHRLYISALEQAVVLILGKYVLIGVIRGRPFDSWGGAMFFL